MSTYKLGNRLNGEQFGRDVFDSASDTLASAVEAGDIAVGNLMSHFAFLRINGRRIDEEAARRAVSAPEADIFAWTLAAKERYRDDAYKLMSSVLMHWKRGAPAGKKFYNKAVKDMLPLACQALIFPITPEPEGTAEYEEAMAVFFDSLADMAGVRQSPVAARLQAAAGV